MRRDAGGGREEGEHAEDCGAGVEVFRNSFHILPAPISTRGMYIFNLEAWMFFLYSPRDSHGSDQGRTHGRKSPFLEFNVGLSGPPPMA